jgi:hypothetical protein
MAQYRIYHVSTFKTRPGKRVESEKWWTEKGEPLYASLPGVKSVNAYVAQFGLGGEYSIEVWLELESYGALDQADQDIVANPEKYAPLAESSQFFEAGPSRLVGDWPASDLLQ